MSQKVSPVSSPQPSGPPDCDKNFLLKSHGLRGIIVAAVIVGLLFIIILISKLNDVRLQRVPAVWRNRLKTMVKDCAEALSMAKDAKSPSSILRYAVEASILLTSSRKLAGGNDLSKMSGFDIGKLESEINSIMKREIPSELQIDTNKK